MSKPWEDFLIEIGDNVAAVFMDWFENNHEKYSLNELIAEYDSWDVNSTCHKEFLLRFINKRKEDLIKNWTEID